MIDQIISYNKTFVAQKGYEKYITDKYPEKKLAVLSCMDTRLTELLPAALGLRNGDAKIIKNGLCRLFYLRFLRLCRIWPGECVIDLFFTVTISHF